MTDHVLVFDLETVRDLAAAARVLGLVDESDETVRLALGPDFPKLPLHRIACIGTLAASRGDAGWRVDSVEPAVMDITIDPNGAQAWLSVVTRI